MALFGKRFQQCPCATDGDEDGLSPDRLMKVLPTFHSLRQEERSSWRREWNVGSNVLLTLRTEIKLEHDELSTYHKG